MAKDVALDTVVSLAKRRGFVFPASEIYGGISGFYDYGPYGVEMVRNLKNLWWRDFVQSEANIYGLDSAIIQHPKLWEASGHLDTFHDPMVQCKECNHLARADHIEGDACPNCGQHGTLGEPAQFNLMFKTQVGAQADGDDVAYLRPETAGGIFAQYENVLNTTRSKLPFGIAQIGKAFRNEISPREFLFRTREFNQMEIEYFVRPEHADEEFKNFKQRCYDWFLKVGVDESRLSWLDVPEEERAHYSAATFDLEFDYSFGKKEMFGIANRTDFDLTAHSDKSGKDLTYFDQENNERFTPYVIEPSFGLDRLFLAILESAYTEEKVKGEKRVVLKLAPEIAPVQVAVLPLSKNEKLAPLARKVYEELKNRFVCEYDETQSIGRRYRRQDEIGTPHCVTVDFDSLDDQQVTIRDRDTMKQDRIAIKDLPFVLEEKLKN